MYEGRTSIFQIQGNMLHALEVEDVVVERIDVEVKIAGIKGPSLRDVATLACRRRWRLGVRRCR